MKRSLWMRDLLFMVHPHCARIFVNNSSAFWTTISSVLAFIGLTIAAMILSSLPHILHTISISRGRTAAGPGAVQPGGRQLLESEEARLILVHLVDS